MDRRRNISSFRKVFLNDRWIPYHVINIPLSVPRGTFSVGIMDYGLWNIPARTDPKIFLAWLTLSPTGTVSPMRLIGCSQPAYSRVIKMGVRHPGPRKKEKKTWAVTEIWGHCGQGPGRVGVLFDEQWFWDEECTFGVFSKSLINQYIFPM